jgi:cytochrome P450
MELLGVMALIIGGGFDATTALTAHALEWLGEHPDQWERLSRERETLLDPATEEFLRFYTPAPGDGRTISADCEIAGSTFKEGERLWLSWAMANRDPALFENPHEIDLARTGNRQMVTAVLDRMPDYQCDPAGAVHYETIEAMQKVCDEQRLAEPVTVRKARADIGT